MEQPSAAAAGAKNSEEDACVLGLMPKPSDHPHDQKGGEDTHPALGVEVEAGTFEAQLMVGHRHGSPLKKHERAFRGTIYLPARRSRRQGGEGWR